MQYHWKNHMWNIISYLIIPKSLTYLLIAFIYKYHWSDRKFTRPLLLLLVFLLNNNSCENWTTTLMRAYVTHSILKLCVAIITVFLHTVMLMSSILLGTKLRDSLHIELNGLKMNQLFGISRLILRSILIIDFISVLWWCLMLVINTALAT